MSRRQSATNAARTEELVQGAARLRSEPGSRKFAEEHPGQGDRWDHPDHEGDDAIRRSVEAAGSVNAAADGADILPEPTRLINKTAVAIVFVDGIANEDQISDAEKWNVIAEWVEATDWISSTRPSANISWEVNAYEATVDMVPWQGATFPGLDGDYYDGFSAAVNNSVNGKIYLFGVDVGANSSPPAPHYVRFSSIAAGKDPGFPTAIGDHWHGMGTFAQGVDAGFWREKNQKIYLFRGAEYVRVDPHTFTVDQGYPKSIGEGWIGTAGTPFADGIDAALGHKGNNSVYFFKGEDYVKFADGSSTVAPHYPRAIAGRWPGLAEALGRVDAALWRDSIERIYFFKNSRFGAKYVRVTPDDFTVEPAYADGKSNVGLSKNDAEALWRNPALKQLGYDGSHDGGRQLCADLVAQTNADQGIVIYVTKLPAVHSAYAGGYRVTLSKPDFGGDLSRVLAHEMLHLFGAPDEYKESSSCTTKHGEFLRATNSNSRACATPPVNCIMDSDQPSMCDATPLHLGWGAFESQIDAAVYRGDTGKTYLFSDRWYARYSDISQGMDAGYPWRISSGFAGLNADFRAGIDAALWREDNEALYLFKGSQYVKFNPGSNTVADNYPRDISAGWHGLPTPFLSRIDAAFWRKSNDRIYMFKGDEYVRLAVESGVVTADQEPRKIAASFAGLTPSFNSGISAALMRRDTNQIYFFAGPRYARFSKVSDGVDDNYPRFIDGVWMPFPR